MSAIPKNLLTPCSMKRVICHWSEGNYKANSTDMSTTTFSSRVTARCVAATTRSTTRKHRRQRLRSAYAQCEHAGDRGGCCCMVGCQETPFKPGSQPMKKSQWNTMVQVVAELCQFYGIHVTPTTVLGHGEVQANLNITQKGKWDPMVWPWATSKTRAQVGATLASRSAALAKPGRSASAVPAAAIRTAAAAASAGSPTRCAPLCSPTIPRSARSPRRVWCSFEPRTPQAGGWHRGHSRSA